MILNGHEDLRVRKTIEAIKNTFEELICEKNYEKITVKELCDRALINKKTFYHYYPTLDDLLGELQMQISEGYIKIVKDYKLPDDIDKLTRTFFEYSAKQGLAYEKITCSSSYSYIRQRMIKKVNGSTWEQSHELMQMDDFRRKLLIEYMNTTTVEIYRQWVEDGKKIPLEEIIDIATRLIYSGANGLLNK